MNFQINCLSEIENYDSALQGIRKIFFETTSRKNFADDIEREEFFHDWTEYYFVNWISDVFVAFNGEQVVGYLTGCRDSTAALPFISPKIETYGLFEEHFIEFPAHLHINTSSDYQGKGIGGQLIEHYKKLLIKDEVPGLHIVTSGESRNIGFYHRHGFTDLEVEKEFYGSRLRFMGANLT